jgi:hypothetical protein
LAGERNQTSATTVGTNASFAPRHESGAGLSGPNSVTHIVASAINKEAALRQLLSQAKAGSVEHLLAVSEIMALCGGGRDGLRKDLENLVPLSLRSDSAWQARAARLGDYCGDAGDLDGQANELIEHMHFRLEMLAEQGDRFAQLYLLATNPPGGNMTETQAEFAKQVMRDARATSLSGRVANMYLRAPSASVLAIDRRYAARGLSIDALANSKRSAATLYQCHNGTPCGANSMLALDYCLRYGDCGAQGGVDYYIRSHELTPVEYEAASEFLALLLSQSAPK